MTQTVRIVQQWGRSTFIDIPEYLDKALVSAGEGDLIDMEYRIDMALHYSDYDVSDDVEHIRSIGHENASVNYLNSAMNKAKKGDIIGTYDDLRQAKKYSSKDISNELEKIRKTCVKNGDVKKEVSRLLKVAEEKAEWGHDERMAEALRYAINVSKFFRNKDINKKARRIKDSLNTRVNPHLIYKNLSYLDDLFT